MGSFFSKKTTPLNDKDIGVLTYYEMVVKIKEANPECIITIIAMKEDDVYDSKPLGADQYVITYNVRTGIVTGVYNS